ncbi:MAG: cation-translocating P-type ATPase, partial [Actinomycetota bacterium]
MLVVASSSPHAQPVQETLATLEVDPERGLSTREAQARLRRTGPNTVGSQRGIQAHRILWQQLKSVVVGLLAVAAGVGFAIGEVIEAVAVLVVLIVNTAVGFVTELRAARAMESLQSLLTVIAEVERDDRRDEIDAEGLVPGDIVGIEAGERVPADLRLFEAEDLTIDESALTGESQPVPKGPEPVAEDAPVADRTSMAFMGTVAATGRGRGVVVSTGRDTQLGGVVELTEDTTQRRAPLQEGLDILGRNLSMGVAAGALVLMVIGVLRGQDLVEVAEVAIAIAIAVVPEGLPAVATLTLAVGMRRMAASGALVRRLPAVETLGSTTVICSDKTGTLTENRMAVRSTEMFAGEGLLWESAALCNDADVDEDGDPVGDPTEVALILAAEKEGLDWRRLREASRREAEFPFDPATKRMAVVVDGVVHAKGAPEVMIDPKANPEQARIADELAADGLRVLAIARGPAPGDVSEEEAIFGSLDVLGVVGMEDPPRP